MSSLDLYRTLAGEGEGTLREKGSRFIAIAFPMEDEAGFAERLSLVRKQHATARHACFAWVLGTDRSRANDDGEPSGTAGRPILQQIHAAGLITCGIIVVRYFGGTLLGKGGLVRAYGGAARIALQDAGAVERMMRTTVEVSCGYAVFDAMRIEVEQQQGAVIDATYAADCSARLALPRSLAQRFAERWRSRGAMVHIVGHTK
ncbi:MAG: YigZ family protein [Flavobacteriales bacterium]|nr:YigZ family protein [Flavobacteriales bacterium]